MSLTYQLKMEDRTLNVSKNMFKASKKMIQKTVA